MSNVHLRYALLCDLAFFDAHQKLSVIGIFQRIFTKTVPAIHPSFSVVSSLRLGGKKAYTQHIRLRRKTDGGEIGQPIELNIPAPSDADGEFICIGQFAGVKFENFGEYEVQIVLDGQEVVILPLVVSPIA